MYICTVRTYMISQQKHKEKESPKRTSTLKYYLNLAASKIKYDKYKSLRLSKRL